MGLFDAFTGGSVTKAAKGVEQRALGTGQNVDTWWQDALNRGSTAIMNGSDSGSDVLTNQLNNSLGALDTGYIGAHRDLTSGYNSANQILGGIQGLYQPYAANGTNASNMLANATGLNGAGGNAAATNAFQVSPGYQFQVDQTTDAAARKAAALGIAGSGNTLTALGTLGSNLANQEYQQWLGNLSGQVGTGMQATAGQAAGLGAQAQLASNYGTAAAGLDTGQGAAQAGLYSNYGSNLSNLFQNEGNSLANLNVAQANGISGANVGLTGQANQAQMQAGQAQMQGSSNLLGAITGIGQSIFGGLGKAAGGGGLSSLFG